MALDTYGHVFDELDGGEQEAIKVLRELAMRSEHSRRSHPGCHRRGRDAEREVRAFLRSIRAGSAGLGRDDVVPAGRADPA
jgi:hypothetical protein